MLEEKARELKTRKVQQLGELVIATGADQLSADELAGALVAITETKDSAKREAWAKRGVMFFESRSRRTGSELSATLAALQRNRAARNRRQAEQARNDMRTWQVERRRRTRHLIELGGLVVKAGIVDLTGDDRSMIFDALIWIADKLRSEDDQRTRDVAGMGNEALMAERNEDLKGQQA